MTEKSIFAYKLFLTLNISDFSLFFMWQLQPLPEKSHSPLSQQPPLKVEVLSSPPPLFENLVGGSLPPSPTPAERGGGWTLCSPGISTSDSTRELSDASFSALSKTKEAPLFLFSDKLELSDGSLLTVSLLFE